MNFGKGLGAMIFSKNFVETKERSLPPFASLSLRNSGSGQKRISQDLRNCHK
jgi:hypothetical protein